MWYLTLWRTLPMGALSQGYGISYSTPRCELRIHVTTICYLKALGGWWYCPFCRGLWVRNLKEPNTCSLAIIGKGISLMISNLNNLNNCCVVTKLHLAQVGTDTRAPFLSCHIQWTQPSFPDNLCGLFLRVWVPNYWWCPSTDCLL